MFDVYLSDRRDHLLVVEKGQPIPIDRHLGRRWHKKRAAVKVSDEIKTTVQREGYYSRRLRAGRKVGCDRLAPKIEQRAFLI
jgi:hypothetical protein